MKHLRKIMALVLSLAMVLAMSITVFAGEVTATVANNTNHAYKAYQVFKGTQQENSKVLGDIEWGNGVVESTIKTKLASSTYFKSATTAQQVADILKGKLNDSAEAKEFARIANDSISGNAVDVAANAKSVILTEGTGYYLFVDQTVGNEENQNDFIKGLSLLQVTGDTITITAKVDKPSVEKKVQENIKTNNTTDNYGDKYNDTADYNIGDNVPFRLYGTVIDMSEFQNGYKYVFHDTAATSLDINKDAKVYYSSDKEGNNKTDIDSSLYRVEYGTDNHSLTVTFDNLRAVKIKNSENSDVEISSGYIIVEYTAKLNSSAAIGQGTIGETKEGNINKVYLEYSNNPNQSGEGQPETGNTPEDKVIVFTYELDVTKIDGADKNKPSEQQKKLKDAEFVLYRGTAESPEYAKVDANAKIQEWTNDINNATTLKSNVNGLFKVIGLDDGTYYLKETKAPNGYNVLKNDIKVQIKADTSNGQNGNGDVAELKTLKVNVNDGSDKDASLSTGIVNITVENNQGSLLPETGGIGTTIFYIVGVVLVLGAGVLLVTKKRMNADK